MSERIPLTPDELLMTTRAVRKRLDFTRPVERAVLEECLTVAQQAPTPTYLQNWHFVVVTDPGKRGALAGIYRRAFTTYWASPITTSNLTFDDPKRNAAQARMMSSAQHLADHMQEAPVHVIPCIVCPGGRIESHTAFLGHTTGVAFLQSSMWSSITQAGWSFMLAARARGLGTVWTTAHLLFEEEAAHVLGLPYAEINQAGLIPVAYTIGTSFRPASREPLHTMVHWETW
jgi:nitroreductase